MKVYLEIGQKKSFASAVDWPGWSRGGKTEDEALSMLLAYGQRYAAAVGVAPARLGAQTPEDLEIVERLTGNATTDFGAPGAVPKLDLWPLSEERLNELIGLLQAAWGYFEEAATKAGGRTLAPAGPRGGGRTLDQMRAHVAEAQGAYIQGVGGKHRPGAPWPETQRDFIAALRARARGELPDVGPRGGQRWPAPYAIRRSVWHALDHAWEIEDRSA